MCLSTVSLSVFVCVLVSCVPFLFLCFMPLPPLPRPLRCVSVCLSYLVLCLSPCLPSHPVSCQSYVFMSACTCDFLSYFVMCVMFGFASSVSLCLISCVSLLFLYPCYSLCKSCVSLCPGISLIPGCVLCLLV